MNIIHANDYKNYNYTVDQYFKKYFIGHYDTAGNHFFAFSIKSQVINWLEPKPITYKVSNKKLIDFKRYLEGLSKK